MRHPRSTEVRREVFIRRGQPERWRTGIILGLRRLGMRRMGLVRAVPEAAMRRLDPRRVDQRLLQLGPRLLGLLRRIRVCRLEITRQADRGLQTVHLLPLLIVEQVPPAVTRPAVRDTRTAAVQALEAPVLALHRLQRRAAMRQAAITTIIQTPAA